MEDHLLLLGMEISQKHGVMSVSQHKMSILEKYDMHESKPVATPGTEPELDREPENAIYLDSVETKTYQGVVGSLLFLTNTTRWNIDFAVMILCKRMAKPPNLHMVAAKRVLRYLRSTPDLPTVFRQGSWGLRTGMRCVFRSVIRGTQ